MWWMWNSFGEPLFVCMWLTVELRGLLFDWYLVTLVFEQSMQYGSKLQIAIGAVFSNSNWYTPSCFSWRIGFQLCQMRFCPCVSLGYRMMAMAVYFLEIDLFYFFCILYCRRSTLLEDRENLVSREIGLSECDGLPGNLHFWRVPISYLI